MYSCLRWALRPPTSSLTLFFQSYVFHFGVIVCVRVVVSYG